MYLKEKLKEEFKNLSPREMDILRLRYGFDDGRQRTLEEIGQLFDVKREFVREIEEKVLCKFPVLDEQISLALLYNSILKSVFQEKTSLHLGIAFIDYDELKKDIDLILNDNFSEDEVKVFNLMFGLSDGSQKETIEIAQELNIREEEASCLEDVVLRKLKHPNCRKILEKYLPKESDRKVLSNVSDEELLDL